MYVDRKDWVLCAVLVLLLLLLLVLLFCLYNCCCCMHDITRMFGVRVFHAFPCIHEYMHVLDINSCYTVLIVR